MVADWLRYDFGYDWPWTMGHAMAAGVFALATWGAWRARRRWLTLLFAALTLWAVTAGIALNGLMRFSRPIEMPSAAFLAGGRGHVLDAGAGSGRSSLMVLLARPEARVTALDIFSRDYGMPDNTPDRLRANARAAGADARLDVRAGDMRSMPFDAGTFDAAVSAFAIDHLNREDRQKTYAELRRVIRPGGDFLLMVVNNDRWIRFTLPVLAHHGYFGPRTNMERWRDELAAAGFELAEHGTQPGALYVLVRNRIAPGS